MKVSCRTSGLLVIAVIAFAMLAACPLPYEYNGPGAGISHTSDPSSPNITAPVTVSYSVQGGSSGTVGDGGTFYAGQTITVTLSTATVNSVIFYTDTGTPLALTGLDSAKKMNGSSGEITLTRTASLASLDIHAVAIGPNMLPSPSVHATVGVSPYPVLSITVDNASVSEDGGKATFTITSSSPAPASGIKVTLTAGGVYDASHVSFQAAPGTFSVTIPPSATTTTLVVTGVHNNDHATNQKVILTIQDDPNSPTTYTKGAPDQAFVAVQDDGSYTVAYNGNGNGGGTKPNDASYLPGATVTAAGNSGNLVKTGYSFAGWNTQSDGNGTTYAVNQIFTMPSSDMILYAKWTPLPVVAVPTFLPGGTTYASAQTVTISCTTSGATIRYTTDGTAPSETAGTVCSSGQQVTVSSFTILKAIAYQSGWLDSAVATSTYTILSSFAGPWTATNQVGTVLGTYFVQLIGTDTYYFTMPGVVFSGDYQKQGNTFVMIRTDNPNYTGFVWTIDSQTHLTLSNTGYAGSTMSR